jgi:hypothetical protein
MSIHVTIKDITAKRIDIAHGFYILAVPDEKLFYDFWIMHDKYESALHMFGTTRAQAPDNETLLYIAHEGWKAYREEYFDMIENE